MARGHAGQAFEPCGIACGCGATCPLPIDHDGRFWTEHPTLIHSHVTPPVTVVPSPRWVPLTFLVALIGLVGLLGLIVLVAATSFGVAVNP